MEIRVSIDDAGVREKIAGITERAGSPAPAMKIIGEIVRRSVQRNFEAGGRPTLWKASQRARQTGGKTLILRNILKRSITYEVQGNSVAVGTNVPYAAAHQFGFDGTVLVRAHRQRITARDIIRRSVTARGRIRKTKLASGIGFVKEHERHMKMPERPFLLVQESDWRSINLALARWILLGRKA